MAAVRQGLSRAGGGFLLTPPAYSGEDYFGISSGANVKEVALDDSTPRPLSTSYFAVAPGVRFALGTPTTATSRTAGCCRSTASASAG